MPNLFVPEKLSRKTLLSASIPLIAVSMTVYALTCSRSVPWWDTPEYATAALTFGVPHAPGSLLLTLIGWIVVLLPTGLSDVFSLNLLAGLLAASTCAIVTLVGLRIAIPVIGSDDSLVYGHRRIFPAVVAAVLAGLGFAFSETLWMYAVMFTPYVLTALFTSLILWSLLRWWENADRADALRWLFIISLLFGLDLSVHRTNFLLLPGLFFWILIKHPQTLVSLKAWVCGLGGLFTGLAAHLITMPMAARDPYMNAGHPSTWSRFWDYLSIKQQGGGFLVQFFPRKADIWNEQVADFLAAFQNSFFSTYGSLGPFGLLSGILGLAGLVVLWRRHRRLAVAFTTLLLVTSVVTVLYFNIPANFFRSLHRHYLPCMTIFATMTVYGASVLALGAWNMKGRLRPVAIGLVALLLVDTAAAQVARNFERRDLSGEFFAEDFARNTLSSLPENAILFVAGDNDTFPLWFLQGGLGERPDVTILNLPLLNTDWYVRQTLLREPDFPLPYTIENLSEIRYRKWADTTIMLPVVGNPDAYGITGWKNLPDSIALKIPPMSGSQYLLAQDWFVLQMLRANNWQRPVYLAATVGDWNVPWLTPYCRMEGYVRRVVPIKNPPANTEILRKNLMERYTYRGYADTEVRLESVSRQVAVNLYAGFLTLVNQERSRDNFGAAQEAYDYMIRVLPPKRLDPPESMQTTIDRVGEQLNEGMMR